MSGYMSVIAPCFSCGTIFSSNPDKVPSYDDQPICEPCIIRVNNERKANGLPLWPVALDAYEATEA